MLQKFIDNTFYYLFVFALVFGVVFMIPPVISVSWTKYVLLYYVLYMAITSSILQTGL